MEDDAQSAGGRIPVRREGVGSTAGGAAKPGPASGPGAPGPAPGPGEGTTNPVEFFRRLTEERNAAEARSAAAKEKAELVERQATAALADARRQVTDAEGRAGVR